MKKLLNTILLLALLLCYNSCIDSKYIYEKEAPIEEFVIVTTGEVTDITSVSASISAYVEQLIIEEGTNVEIGIVYSSTDSIPDINNGITILSDSEAEGKYTVSLTGLSDNTTYFYRSYVITDNNVYYGEVSMFTTKSIIVTTGAATDITSVSASISGSVSNLAAGITNVEIGVVYSENSNTPSIGNGTTVKSDSYTNGDFTISIADLWNGITYYYRTYVKIADKVYYGDVLSFTTKDEITFGQDVDLGLSVKWAGWNVGATSPEQYGGYYAWGEIEEKSDYSESTYTHYNNGYINIGDNISGTQYDVATVKWGNGWRMPTKEECKELYDNCRFEGYTYGGVVGVKVTGPNGNAIFLPAAGYRYGTSLSYAGYAGYYWGGSLYGYSNYAWYLYVSDDGYHIMSNYYREYGLSVRPVRDY